MASAYEIVLTPAVGKLRPAPKPQLWEGSFEAEDATYTGGGYSRSGDAMTVARRHARSIVALAQEAKLM